MSDTLPPPLPPSLTTLLAAERNREGLSDAAKQRILERLETSWPPPRRTWLTTLGAFAGGLLLGAALCGIVMSARLGPMQPKLLMLDSPPPPPPVIVVVRAAAPPALAPPPPHVSPSSPAGTRTAPSQLHSPPLPTAADDPDTELARERALIETARTALARKQPDVIDLLLRHTQQFPRGRLAEERESLLVQALLQTGRVQEARNHGERFRAHWPHSLLLPVINAALQTIP